MTITTIYEAEDGTQFLSEEACREYEEKAKQPFQKVLNAMRVIKEFCDDCDNCPFMEDDCTCKLRNDFPSRWDI